MAEKVTLRFEQFDSDNDNSLNYQAPVSIYKTVENLEQLEGLTDEASPHFDPNFPDAVFTDGALDKEASPDVVVFVKNVTNETGNLQYRGAYFRHNYATGSWVEIALGAHSHENKDILDKIGSGDPGFWNELTSSSVTFSTDFPATTIANSLFFDTVEEKLYTYLTTRAWLELSFTSGASLPSSGMNVGDIFYKTSPLVGFSRYDSTLQWLTVAFTQGTSFPSSPAANAYFYNTSTMKFYRYTNWHEISRITMGTALPVEARVRDFFYNTGTDKLYIFTSTPVGQRKMLVLEVTDPDNTDLTYSYDVRWEDIPAAIPEVPEDNSGLYLGIGTDGTPSWKNSFVASQAFQFKTITVASTTNTVTFTGVQFDPELDEALVLDGNFFLSERAISYNATTDQLTVTGGTDQFTAGEKVSLLVIRNGAAAILETLATDYVTKEEAITLLTGGSVNLSNYATKQDLAGKSDKGHTHSGFSLRGHDHDFRYANFRHTHEQYLTRAKALEIIQNQLEIDPTILTVLGQISTYLETEGALQDLIDALTGVATQDDIENLQDQIDTINSTHWTSQQVRDYIREEAVIDAHQVQTELLDTNSNPMDLAEVLQDFDTRISEDLGTLNTNEVILDSNINVSLGTNGFVGNFDTGETVTAGRTIYSVLSDILRRRIPATYAAPVVNATISAPSYAEVGSTVQFSATFNPLTVFQQNQGGPLSLFTIARTVQGDSNTYYPYSQTTAPSSSPFSASFTIENQPATIAISAQYLDGPVLNDNLGDPSPTGKILAGTTAATTKVITPVRSIIVGHSATDTALSSINSSFVRSNGTVFVDGSYEEYSVGYEVPAGARVVYFAVPNNTGITSILYSQQGSLDILDLFTELDVAVQGANGYSSAQYDVYAIRFPLATPSKMNLRFVKE